MAEGLTRGEGVKFVHALGMQEGTSNRPKLIFFFNVQNVMHTFVSIHAFKSGTPFEGSGLLLGGKATEKVVLVISHTLTSLIKIKICTFINTKILSGNYYFST